MIDYKKTYVKVSNEEELEKALSFYEEKLGRTRFQGRLSIDWHKYVGLGGIGITNYTDPMPGEIDITEEVLGPKEEQKYAVHCKTEEEFRTLQKVWTKKGYTLCLGSSPMERGIWYQNKENTCCSSENMKLEFSDINYYNSIGYKILSFEEGMEKLGEKVEKLYITREHIEEGTPIAIFNGTQPLLNYKQPVKMNTLRELMFGTVDLKKLATLVETTEERLEPITALSSYLRETVYYAQSIIMSIETATEEHNKANVKKHRKELEKLIEEKLNDKLMEQLLLIGKKLLK